MIRKRGGEVGTLLLRADSGPRIGAGHVMRSLALAEAWHARGGDVVLAGRCESAPLRNRIQRLGARLVTSEGLDDPAALVRSVVKAGGEPPHWFVVDGYGFTASYHDAIRAAGYRLLVIDDNRHQTRYNADILLNQNLHAAELGYTGADADELLLGTAYALLRKEFRHRTVQRTFPVRASRLLVTLGGGATAGPLAKVLSALDGLRDGELEVVAVQGQAGAERPESRTRGGATIRWATGPEDMSELMAWADMAITAAGSTCWELCYMGLPALLLVTAENQRRVAASIHASGAGEGLGHIDSVSEEEVAGALHELSANRVRREAMGKAGQAMVDGRGAERVVERLLARPPIASRETL